MLLPLLLLLSELFGLLGLFSPPYSIPFRILLGLLLHHLLEIRLVDGKLSFLIEYGRTEDRGRMRGDWDHDVGRIWEDRPPFRGCNRMQFLDLSAHLGCKG